MESQGDSSNCSLCKGRKIVSMSCGVEIIDGKPVLKTETHPCPACQVT
ncbi:MAG: hypothetical protein WC248_02725 [Candidatus Methanomethylophilaceae archaeon]